MRINYWHQLKTGITYHIYNRSVGETDLYRNHDNYLFFLKKWTKYIAPYFEIHAYCLMPNHFHFLASVKPMSETMKTIIKKELTVASEKFIKKEISYNTFLEDQFKRLFSSYSLAFNKQHGRTGTLLQKRFKRVSLSEEKIMDKFFYIHHNPIHHHFSANYKQWEYSSFIAYFSSKPTRISKEKIMNLIKYHHLEIGAKKANLLEYLKNEHQAYKLRRADERLDDDDF